MAENEGIDTESPLDFVQKRIDAARARNTLPSGAPVPTTKPQINPLNGAPQTGKVPVNNPIVTELSQNAPKIPENVIETSQNTPELPENEASEADFVPEFKIESAPKEPEKTPPIEQIDELEVLLSAPDDDKTVASQAAQKNFKLLKTALKTTKETLSQKDKVITELTEKTAKYEKGELIPEVYTQSQQRIAELEEYEKIHALKKSPSYKKKVIEPLDSISDRLSDIAESYKVEPEFLEQAVGIEDEAELNKTLSSKFDTLGAVEVKNLIKRAREIQSNAREMEAEPQNALRKLEDEHRSVLQTENFHRRNAIAEKGKSVWAPTVQKLREEGSATALLIKNADPDYVEKYVQPMMQRAAIEYGKFIKGIAESGATELSDEMAEGLARMTMLAYDNALAQELSKSGLKELERYSSAAKRFNPLLFPPVGQQLPANGPAPQPASPKSARDVGREHINSIIRK